MIATTVLTLTLAIPTAPEAAPDTRDAVQKGLKWLAGLQDKDGSWSGKGGMYRAAMTGFAGLALLMEGSTLQDGPYREHLRRAVAWCEKVARPTGLIAPSDNAGDESRYMLGHGIALTFLATAYDVDDDDARRTRVAKLLDAAVKFAADGQTSRGGWGYVSARDGSDFDEANATVTILQALRAAEKAGVKVPPAVSERAVKYLVASTNREGGVIYTLANGSKPMGGDGRPVMTAAAAAAVLMSDARRPDVLPRWVAFTGRNASLNFRAAAVDGNTLLHHYHLARVVNALGETGHQKLDPGVKDAQVLRWSAYRGQLFKSILAGQAADGSWPDQYIGPAYSTTLALIILQLDNNYLPAFSK